MLKLERQCASSNTAKSISEPKQVESINETAVEPDRRFSESQNAGSANEDSENQTWGKGRLKVEEIRKFGVAAAKRAAEKRRG